MVNIIFCSSIPKCSHLICSSLINDLRKLYLFFNVFSISPIYVSLLDSLCVKVALQTIHSVRHFPSRAFFSFSAFKYSLTYGHMITFFCSLLQIASCKHSKKIGKFAASCKSQATQCTNCDVRVFVASCTSLRLNRRFLSIIKEWVQQNDDFR